MSNRIHALAQQLTGKKSVEECSLDELRHVAKRHPYFAPAQFLLLQKLRLSGTPEDAEVQYRKAVLFYHDPLLFEHFISSNKFYVEEILTQSEVQHAVHTQPEATEAIAVEAIDELPQEITGDQLETLDVAIENEKNVEEQNDTAQQDIEGPSVSEEELAPAVSSETIPIESETETLANKEEKEGQPAATELAPLPEIKTNGAETSNTELSFEPFHTVDYFASQGIKISQEEAPKDKLGKQLKSFTEWLRTMKRLPAAHITETVETSAEKKVETLASHSVSESNVVTEAMAEVWLKQGATEKALDIYNKLSLLNPSKKAYFAAKIENLKQS